jgi:hypothetical protein
MRSSSGFHFSALRYSRRSASRASVEVGSARKSCFHASIALSGVPSWVSDSSAISIASALARASTPVGADRRQRLLGLAQDRHQLAALAAPAVVRAVEVQRHRVRGVELADAAEVVLGGVEVAEPLPQDHPDLQQHPEVAVAAAHLERAA